MKKRIAVLTQKNSLSRGIQNNTTVNVFELEDEQVVGVENFKLENPTDNYFSLLMALKEVCIVYMQSINKDLRRLLETIGIKTKCADETNNDKFIQQFIFD
ncbi:MAG TPA: hypothetical protein DIT04_08180 [Dysgonomonas sp.]|nr:hypothetical protein [Dysgonomonas sp.]